METRNCSACYMSGCQSRNLTDKSGCLLEEKEPVGSINFEQEIYKAFGQVKDFTLCVQIAKRFYNMGRFDAHIQDGDKIVTNEEGARVNLSRLKRVARRDQRFCMYSKDNYTDEDRKVLCDGCEEECKFNKKEEPVSEYLQKEVNNWRHEHFHGRRDMGAAGEYLERNSQYDLARHAANWQKQQMIKVIIGRLEDAGKKEDESADVGELSYYKGMVDGLGRLRDEFQKTE